MSRVAIAYILIVILFVAMAAIITAAIRKHRRERERIWGRRRGF